MPRHRYKPTAAEVENDPIILAIDKFLDRQPEGWWCGSATELHAELNEVVSEALRRRTDFWPQTPKGLSMRLGTLSVAIGERNIIMTRRNVGTRGFCISRRIKAAA